MSWTDEPGTDSDGRPSAPPGPSGLPLLGNLHQLVRGPLAFYDRLREYDEDVVTYSIFGEDAHLLKHPDYVEQVLVTDAPKYVRGRVVTENLGTFAGDGLFVVEGEQWRTQRRLMQPVFTLDRLGQYGDVMASFAERAADDWADGQVVAIDQAMRRLTLEILGRTLFGIDIRGNETAVQELADATIARFDASRLTVWLPPWVPTPRNVRLQRALGRAQSFVEDLVADRRADAGESDDLLSLLVDAGDDNGALTDTEVRDNLLSFLFAGHETTALALTYTWYLLATHPAKASRLRAELESVLEGETPTVDDLEALEYTERVVREALRLYPPAFANFREPIEHVEIGGYAVSEGTVLALPPYVVHRDGRWYDDPATFRPDRWREDVAADRPEYAYFPFGGGPRHCIGMRFAMMEAKLAVAAIAQSVRFEHEGRRPLDLAASVTLQPAREVPLRVQRLA